MICILLALSLMGQPTMAIPTSTRTLAIISLIRDARGDRIGVALDLYTNARARAVALARADRFDNHAGAGAIRADRWQLWGEIVGWNQPIKATPRWFVNAWLASPTHRSVMLAQRWDALGISCASAATGRVWCVVVFGDRR